MITPRAAAELIRLDYRAPAHLHTLAELDVQSVQARIVQIDSRPDPDVAPALVNVLVITGTNERSDWHLANFRWWPLPHTTEGDTRRWHRGFYRHAASVYSFATGWIMAGDRIDIVIGHSLGAAAAQIVGSSLPLQTFCFASPRPLWGDKQPPGWEYVTSWCDRSDPVCKVPPIGFSHVGRVVWHDSGGRWWRANSHAIERYLEHLP